MNKTHRLWRLPLSGRLHANKQCDLLKQERTNPSPMDHQRSLLEHASKRPFHNHPIEQSHKDIMTVAAHLCSCARHLLK